jgi:hypothetical protein
MCFFSTPTPPAPQPPAPVEPPKIAEKAPEVQAAKSTNKAKQFGGMNAGPASTFLTGPGGVDPNQLEIGRVSLLGNNKLLGG